MKYRKIGKTGPTVSAIGFGCMALTESYGACDRATGEKVLRKAYENGVTFFDTADGYGLGKNEELVGRVIKDFRGKIVLATKCGIQINPADFSHTINNRPKYIKKACEASLKRLGTDVIDLYYLHRFNPEVPIEESMGAMLQLVEEGKVLNVGLSEVEPRILQRASAVLGDKLVAVQTEYSLANRTVADAILPECKKLNVSFIAYSPLGRGLLSGAITNAKVFKESAEFDFRSILPQFQENMYEQNLRFTKAISAIAAKKKCTPSQLSLAWLLAQGDNIVPIPGTKHENYLLENLKAVDVELSEKDLSEIQDAIDEFPIQGSRYPEELLKIFHLNA